MILAAACTAVSELSWNSLLALSESDRKAVLDEMFSVGVGVGFGIYPAIRASKFDPIVALRFS